MVQYQASFCLPRDPENRNSRPLPRAGDGERANSLETGEKSLSRVEYLDQYIWRIIHN
jgi:hypothetical protein